MSNRDFAFGKDNFLWIAVSVVLIIIGFSLMSGGGSGDNTFNPEIFSATRIKVAPAVCFIGFVSIVYAIIRKPKDNTADDINTQEK